MPVTRLKRIKLKCPKCGKTTSIHRADYDPPEAVLLVIRCPDCAVGCKEDGGTYYDRRGEEISYQSNGSKN